MRNVRVSTVLVVIWCLMASAIWTGSAGAVGTAFTYQGVLMDMHTPADGLYDLEFKLFDHPDPNVGWQWGDTISIDSLDIIEGCFTVELDFNDGVFDGAPRWLEAGVRWGELNDPNEYTILLPRQRLTTTPYALHAKSAGGIVGQDSLTSVENQTISYAGPYDSLYELTSAISESKGLIPGSTVIYEDNNNVGIGTTSPIDKLHLDNPGENTVGIFFEDPSASSSYGGRIYFHDSSNTFRLVTKQAGSEKLGIAVKRTNGNVGIGTASPIDKLHLDNPGASTVGIFFEDPTASSNYGGRIYFHDSSNTFRFVTKQAGSERLGIAVHRISGNVGIGTSSPAAKLDVAGTTRTQILEVTGGADLAEPFKIGGADSVQPGMVVCIDSQRSGHLRVSAKAYDRTVAGVISGANGIKAGLTMKQQNTVADGDHPVALTGRVYCLCDASFGPVNPGDLLTTSDTPGHAMKVTDHTRASGAILGKAMSNLEEGKGIVLILVSLQ